MSSFACRSNAEEGPTSWGLLFCFLPRQSERDAPKSLSVTWWASLEHGLSLCALRFSGVNMGAELWCECRAGEDLLLLRQCSSRYVNL